MDKDFCFEQSFGKMLGAAHTAMIRHLGNLMKEKSIPLTPEQFRVLSYLWKQDGLQQSELAQCTQRNRANVTRIIDILEREGIVERKDDPDDRRVFRIYLTELGRSLRCVAAACAHQATEDALAGLTEEERSIASSVLQKISGNLDML